MRKKNLREIKQRKEPKQKEENIERNFDDK